MKYISVLNMDAILHTENASPIMTIGLSKSPPFSCACISGKIKQHAMIGERNKFSIRDARIMFQRESPHANDTPGPRVMCSATDVNTSRASGMLKRRTSEMISDMKVSTWCITSPMKVST